MYPFIKHFPLKPVLYLGNDVKGTDDQAKIRFAKYFKSYIQISVQKLLMAGRKMDFGILVAKFRTFRNILLWTASKG